MEDRRRSLEEALASVMEGEGVVLGGDGMYFFREPTHVSVTKPHRRRRRVHASRHAGVGEDVLQADDRRETSSLQDRDKIVDLDRIIVGYSDVPESVFRITPITIRYIEHERSPFVVSLRGLSLSSDAVYDDERLMASECLEHDIRTEEVPDLETIRSLADDLHINETTIKRLDEQFTVPSSRPVRSFPFRILVNAWSAIRRGIRRVFSAISLATSSDRERAFEMPMDSSRSEEGGSPSAEPVLRIHYIRSLGFLSLLILIAMLPANIMRVVRDLQSKQEAVAAAGGEAIGAWQAAQSGDIDETVVALRNASESFREADTLLSQTNAVALGLAQVLPSARNGYRSGRALLEVGSKSADAGRLLAKGLQSALEGGRGVLERLGVISAYADGALPLLEDASTALADVDPDIIPDDRRETFDSLRSLVENGRTAVREFVGMADLLSVLIGRDQPRRYLVIFQNPSELRPTGGFMGSYAELDMDRGEISRFEIPGGGTYDLQGQLIAQVIPPKPLQLIAERWEFQDSNWSPDFPTAAEQMRYFWTKSGGYSVDGIIAVNATLVERLLSLTGPIEVPELGKTITAENFMLETQKAVELEYDKTENKPKKILGLIAPELIRRLSSLDREGMLKAAAMFSDAMRTKDVQIALMNESEEALAEQFGWNGRIKPAVGDALAVIGANIAGQKTDLSMKESVEHRVVIEESGTITDTVVMQRAHEGQKGDAFSGVRNVTYFRFYVPRGSTLISASGFDEPASAYFSKPREDAVPDPAIALAEASSKPFESQVSVWDEGDRTVIGGWSLVDPGQSDTLTIRYRLPLSAFDLRNAIASSLPDASDQGRRSAYTLLLTSQSGKANRTVSASVQVPDSWSAAWSRSGESYDGAWDRDRVLSVLYSTNE